MKRFPTKSFSGAAVGSLAVLSVLTGCSGTATNGTDSQAAVTSISVLHYFGDKGAVPEALNKCAAKAGVTLESQTPPSTGYVGKVLQQASSKTLPDILMLDNPDVQQIAATGALAPLSDYNISTDGFAQEVLKASTYNGQVYGLQPAFNTIALFYNKDLLAKAGVQPPTTWEELKAAAGKLTSGGQYGMASSEGTPSPGTWDYLPFLWSNSGDEKDFASPQATEALQVLVDLVKSGSMSSGVLTWSQGDVKDQFVAGKAAMMINGSWNIPTLDKVSGLNYGIVKIPVKSASDTPFVPLGGEAWTVPQTGNKAKQAKAAEIVGCINSDEMQLAIAKGDYYIPSKTTLAAQFAAENPKLAVFADLVKTVRARTGELGADWPKTETQIYNAIQSALTGKASPLEALKQAQNDG